MKILRSLLVFPNLSIAAFDEYGQQIPELQTSIVNILAERAVQLGFDPSGTTIHTRDDGTWRLVKDPDGTWNRERI